MCFGGVALEEGLNGGVILLKSSSHFHTQISKNSPIIALMTCYLNKLCFFVFVAERMTRLKQPILSLALHGLKLATPSDRGSRHSESKRSRRRCAFPSPWARPAQDCTYVSLGDKRGKPLGSVWVTWGRAPECSWERCVRSLLGLPD